ncbi:MAG: hypothetical protein II442_07025, partial [Oscillospiraceae bacterium]|nr:hypothetical protein [Oscillospiraceae bacterium]
NQARHQLKPAVIELLLHFADIFSGQFIVHENASFVTAGYYTLPQGKNPDFSEENACKPCRFGVYCVVIRTENRRKTWTQDRSASLIPASAA